VLQYIVKFGGFKYALLAIFTAFVAQLAFSGISLWLSVWVGEYSHNDSANVLFYLAVHAVIIASYELLLGLSLLIFQNRCLKAAQSMHRHLLEAVFGVSLNWYNTISTGEITNRFLRDIHSLDSLIVRHLQKTVELFLRLVLRVFATGSIMPIFAIPAALACVMGIYVGELYTRAASSVKRLSSESQSPVFAHFTETLAGLSVVRARYGMRDILANQLALKLRVYARALEAQYSCNRWVAVRTESLAAIVALGAGSIAIARSNTVSSGLVGFSLTNAIGLSQTIIQLVRNVNELEIELRSFQRVQEYTQLPQERPGISDPAPLSWPLSGTVEFRNVTARYKPNGPDILKDVSLVIGHGERVAVVGRTGSGKITLVI